MRRRTTRDLRPCMEEIERRNMLSAITDIMAANSIAAGRQILDAAAGATTDGSFSTTSIAVPENQGPAASNQVALCPRAL